MPSFRPRPMLGLAVATALLTLAAGWGAVIPPAGAAGSSFRIGLIGDTGYSTGLDADLLAVRASMAGSGLAFEVHDGDIQKQGSPCTDSRLVYVKGVFNGFAAPFVYTPGDNEWANCPNPSSRLSAIRRTFFSSSKTLGRTTMSVTRQGGTPENARWSRNGVFFAGGTPAALINAVHARTIEFGRPVVLVNGDTHIHRVDKPWKDAPNFTRVETYGDSGTNHWVKATVNPSSPAVFSFSSVTAK